MIFSSYVSLMSDGRVQAAGEVIDATRVCTPSVLVNWLMKSLRSILTFFQNVPRALRKVWIRMYVEPLFLFLMPVRVVILIVLMRVMPVHYSTWGGS